jgi:hypothetical protein
MSSPQDPHPSSAEARGAAPRAIKETFDRALNHPAARQSWGAAKVAYATIAAVIGFAAAVIGLGVNLSADAGFSAARASAAAAGDGRWSLAVSARNEGPQSAPGVVIVARVRGDRPGQFQFIDDHARRVAPDARATVETRGLPFKPRWTDLCVAHQRTLFLRTEWRLFSGPVGGALTPGDSGATLVVAADCRSLIRELARN